MKYDLSNIIMSIRIFISYGSEHLNSSSPCNRLMRVAPFEAPMKLKRTKEAAVLFILYLSIYLRFYYIISAHSNQ